MRKEKSNLPLIIVLAFLMFLLAACVPAADHPSPTEVSSAPASTADVVLSAYPDPTPAPSQEQSELQVGDVIWGPNFINDAAQTGELSFHEELLEDQSYAAEFAEWVYSRCYDGPPALASVVAAFPSLMTGCHLSTVDPVEINHLMYYSNNGGEIQTKLLANLEELLTSPSTILEVVHVSGLVQMPQAYVLEANGNHSILGLRWTKPFPVEDATQLKVTRIFADGSKEVGYFDDECGDCLSIPVESPIEQ